jgi:DNA-binding response OmpR family regulator
MKMGNNPARGTKEPPVILIVDDEISIAETLAEFVMELGYTPLIAYNGQQALALARERWPILVMTDMMMPLLNGAGLVQGLRAEAKSRKKALPPIILLSAVHEQMLKDLHVDVIVPKPFDLDHLEQVVYRLLGGTT